MPLSMRCRTEKPIVCQLSDFSPEYAGSFIDSLLCLANHCRKTIGTETLCIFPERARGRAWLNRLKTARIEYAFVPRTRNIVLPLIKLLRGHYPIIFHSHFETFDLSPLLLKSFLYRDAKVVWQFHSIAQLTRQQRIKDMIKVGIIARQFADLFVAVGDNVYDNILQRGFPRERTFLNHNGIDIEKFCAKGGIAPRGVLADGPKQGVSYLLLGYDPLIKGVDLFVKAAARLCDDGHRNRRFIIVARKETRDFVSRMPEVSLIQNGFEIIDPVENFAKLLAEMDVLVVASRTEGLSYAALEALAAGRLVISSELPGVRETYGKSDGVWLFPVERWEHLAELMRMVEGLSPGERERLGKANSAYAAAHHSLDGWARRTVECYRRVLNSLPAA